MQAEGAAVHEDDLDRTVFFARLAERYAGRGRQLDGWCFLCLGGWLLRLRLFKILVLDLLFSLFDYLIGVWVRYQDCSVVLRGRLRF